MMIVLDPLAQGKHGQRNFLELVYETWGFLLALAPFSHCKMV